MTAQVPDANVIQEAEAHLVNGRYAAAIGLLERQLVETPKNPEALRLLARALYWFGDLPASSLRYEEALRYSPDNTGLRIEAARFFLETSRTHKSEVILEPLLSAPNADVLALLGTIRYWGGDWTSARDYFERALAITPHHPDARRQLNEILAATPSRLVFVPEFQSDNQPIRRNGGLARYTTHLNPLSPLTFEAGFSRASINDTARTFARGLVSIRFMFPGGNAGIDASSGVVQISSRAKPEWTFLIGLLLRLPESTTLSGRFERRAYFETIPSFSIPVSLTSWSFLLDRPRSDGWIGQAVFEAIRYYDGNAGTHLSAWILFPVGKARNSGVRMGYGFGLQHTRDSRFDTTSGTYTPYYTPLNIVSHSLLLSLQFPAAKSLNIHMNGSYGLFASEEHVRSSTQARPMIPGPPKSTPEISQRTFHPWQLRFAIDFNPAETPVQIQVEATRFETAYYQVSMARLTASYTFPVQLR